MRSFILLLPVLFLTSSIHAAPLPADQPQQQDQKPREAVSSEEKVDMSLNDILKYLTGKDDNSEVENMLKGVLRSFVERMHNEHPEMFEDGGVDVASMSAAKSEKKVKKRSLGTGEEIGMNFLKLAKDFMKNGWEMLDERGKENVKTVVTFIRNGLDEGLKEMYKKDEKEQMIRIYKENMTEEAKKNGEGIYE